MIDIDGISKQLSQKTKHHMDDWREALNAAIHDPAFSQMTDGEIHQLSQALASPEQLNWLTDIFREAFMKSSETMPFDYIMGHVQISAYSLTDWISALHTVFMRISKSGRPCDLEALVATVLDCLPKRPGGANLGPLSELVETALAK